MPYNLGKNQKKSSRCFPVSLIHCLCLSTGGNNDIVSTTDKNRTTNFELGNTLLRLIQSLEFNISFSNIHVTLNTDRHRFGEEYTQGVSPPSQQCDTTRSRECHVFQSAPTLDDAVGQPVKTLQRYIIFKLIVCYVLESSFAPKQYSRFPK